MQISECLFMAAELLHVDSGHQASPVFTIILSFWNIAHTLLVQPICFIKAASTCILEGLHTDVYYLYTKPFTLVKTNSCLLSHTLLWIWFPCFGVGSLVNWISYTNKCQIQNLPRDFYLYLPWGTRNMCILFVSPSFFLIFQTTGLLMAKAYVIMPMW